MPGDFIGSGILGDIIVSWPRDDQGCPSLVDEDVVDLVHDGVVQPALGLLHLLGKPVVSPSGHSHVVTQIVEAELVVGAIGDVAGIGPLPFVRLHARLDGTDRQPEAHVEGAHPLHVAASQIVVDGDDMHPLALERIEVGRQRCHQRLALAGDHFGDRARVQHHAADQLDIVVPHAEEPSPRLTADGEGLHQQVVNRLTSFQPPFKFGCLGPQLGIGHCLVAWLERVDRLDLRLEPFEVPGVRGTEESGDEPFNAASDGRRKVADGIPDAFQLFHGACVRGAKKRRNGRRCHPFAPATGRQPHVPAAGHVCDRLLENLITDSRWLTGEGSRRLLPAGSSHPRLVVRRSA